MLCFVSISKLDLVPLFRWWRWWRWWRR